MLKRLLNLIPSNDFESMFDSLLEGLDFEAKGLDFENHLFVNHYFNEMTSFILNDGVYKMSVHVGSGVKEDNVEINLNKQNVLSINVDWSSDKAQTRIKMRQVLPNDADPDTIEANIIDDTLVITVNQIKK